jgi:hypothetical protein
VRVAAVALGTLMIGGACANAQIPAPDPKYYKNDKYQFSLDLPEGFPACVSEHTNHGVFIILKTGAACNDHDDRLPYVGVFANYNVGSEMQMRDQMPARTPSQLARIECLDSAKGRIEWLHRVRLGGRRAAGCRQYSNDGRISMWIVTLRKTPESADVWIELTADLETTADRYNDDMRIFRSVLKTVWIHPDGAVE